MLAIEEVHKCQTWHGGWYVIHFKQAALLDKSMILCEMDMIALAGIQPIPYRY